MSLEATFAVEHPAAVPTEKQVPDRSGARPTRTQRRRRRRRTRVGSAVIVGIIGFAQGWVTTTLLAPLWSSNADEGVYLDQATLLGGGHVNVRVPIELGEFVRPWFAAWTDRGLVYKYPPVWPTVIAAAQLLGDWKLAAGVAGAVFALGVLWLAGSTIKSPVYSCVAVAIALTSPMIVILGAGLLPYVFFSGLVAIALAAVISTVTASGAAARRYAVIAGFVGALATIGRPYESVLVLGPALIWLLIARDPRRARRESLWSLAGSAAVGAAIPVGLFLAYSRVVTGRWIAYLYTAWSPQDRLGFGWRALTPSGTGAIDFDIRTGIESTLSHLELFALWGPLSLLGLGFAGLAAWSGRRRSDVRLLLVVALAVPLGYLGNWAILHAGSSWDGSPRFGPMYFVPVVAPTAVLVTIGVRWVVDSYRPIGVPLIALAAVLTCVTLVPPVRTAVAETSARQRAYRAVLDALPSGRSVLVVPGSYPGLSFPGLQHYLGADFDVVLAVANGTPASAGPADGGELLVAGRFPSRAIYRIESCGYSGGAVGVGTGQVPAGRGPRVSGRRIRLEEVTVSEGSQLSARVVVAPPTGSGRAQVEVVAGRWRSSGRLEFAKGAPVPINVMVAPNGVQILGASSVRAMDQPFFVPEFRITVSFASGRALTWFVPLATERATYRITTPAMAAKRTSATDPPRVWCPGPSRQMTLTLRLASPSDP